MQINVKLDEGFTAAFYDLCRKYGDDMRSMNGFSESQLNYTDFIDHFIDKNSKNVADASIDGNSNVGTKDITSLLNEMNKPHMKLLSFNKIYCEIRKKYGVRRANEWLEAEWNGKFYLHDSYSTSFLSYCIMPQECCSFVYNDSHYHCSFEDIYDMIEEEECYDDENRVHYKRPKNLRVLDYDRDNNVPSYTRVTMISRKSSDHDFYFVKSCNGANVITTDEHKFITPDGDVNACELEEHADMLYTAYDDSQFTDSLHSYEGIVLDRAKGLEVGSDIQAGVFFRGSDFENIRLVSLYCHFGNEFLKGLLAGIINCYGEFDDNGNCSIRLCSRTLVNQVREIGMHFGVSFSGGVPERDCDDVYSSVYVLYTNIRRNYGFFSSIGIDMTGLEALRPYKPLHESQACDVKKTMKTSDVVFDLTTESHTFVCNGILVHNCFSYDLSRVATEGLFFVNDFNHQAPKHLVTFTDFATEFVSWVSNRTSGGCSIPNYIIWSYYFWKHDVETGYYIKSPEYYRKQEFQRLVYKLNQPFLRITQSAYTTLSILDEDYVVELFGGMEFPDGTYVIDQVDEIIEHEKVFMDVVRECHEQNMMTFPVISCALIYDYDNHKFKHEEFARWCSDSNAKWMDTNFSIDDGVNALSSCCVKGETIICVRNTISGEESIYQIQDFINQFNDKDEEYIRKCDTKFEIKAFDYEKNEWIYKNIIGLIRKKNDYDFLLKFNVDGKKIEVTPDHIMCVIDTEINQMIKISAIELSRNIDKYLLVIDE